MLIVASDISTEIYFSRVSEEFQKEKLATIEGFDEDSALQLYAAPLILGFYAISERDGSNVWESPQEGSVFYTQASDLVIMVVQLVKDEQFAEKYLEIVAELIELICGPMASYSLSKRSANQYQLSELLNRAADDLLSGSDIPPLMFPGKWSLSKISSSIQSGIKIRNFLSQIFWQKSLYICILFS